MIELEDYIFKGFLIRNNGANFDASSEKVSQ